MNNSVRPVWHQNSLNKIAAKLIVIRPSKKSRNLLKRLLEPFFVFNTIHLCMYLLPSCRAESRGYRCVYPTMALISNSCACNSRCLRYGQHGIEIRAQSTIQEGEEITIQYQTLISGSRKRREKFRDIWFFDCQCPRCRDPSERGSYLNGFKCCQV